MPITIASESDSILCIVGMEGTLTRILLCEAHTAPYGAISYDVGMRQAVHGYHSLTNRNTSDL